MENEILLNKVKQVGARNVTNNLPVDVVSTSKPLINKNIKEVVDLYGVYREEYSKCHRYRITLTLKPYCTNVLFNTCTEIVKGEGTDTCQVVYDTNQASINVPLNSVYGRNSSLKRAYMVSNTEYSSPEDDLGYTYYPGFDIFDNHTLRNLSFRPVLLVENVKISETRDRFNTTIDYLRTKDGKTIEFYPRFSYDDVESTNKVKMHIYEHSNLLEFFDGSSEEANLTVENGWYGFKNASSISQDDATHIEHVYSHTINNYGNCEFLDMFPDRTRFSLVPKYNKYRNRYEKNWDVFLTYPWKNFYNHNLVNNVKRLDDRTDADKKTYALSTLSVNRTRVSTNRKTMVFRTFCRHGLAINDNIAVYLSKDYGETYTRLPREYTVDYLGDVNGNNTDYFFGISSKTLLNDIFEDKIETTFYHTTQDSETVSVSGGLTEVPDFYDDSEVVRVYRYMQEDTPSQQSYTDAQTFRTMPKTINEYSEVFIRVYNGEYVYWHWDGDSNLYVQENYPNPQVSYGNWNTYTDVPVENRGLYIRTNEYDYYHINSDEPNYAMNDIDIDGTINALFESQGWHMRFVKVVGGVDCKYYIRQFRKVPNLKFSDEPLPNGITQNEDGFLKFVEENASDSEGHMISFDSELYKLAFSKTLYGDDVAQMTFLDTMDIENLTDNLGRPVTEIYSTVVKRNKGYKNWYSMTGESNYNSLISSPDMEYSRCFGSLVSGFDYPDLDVALDGSSSVREIKGMMSSIGLLYKDENAVEPPMSLEDWDSDKTEKEITETDDVFFGDVVEYNPSKCTETVLSDACFRFNTAQRELGKDSDGEDYNFTYHELTTDDYDPTAEGKSTPFLVTEYTQWNTYGVSATDDLAVERADDEHRVPVRRHEGYFYKPHTRIQLLKYSDNVSQGSCRSLRVKECRPLQAESMYIKVTTYTMHGVGTGTVLYICKGKDWIPTTVAHVIDNYRFAMSPLTKEDALRNGFPYMDWVEVCEGISKGNIKIRVHNDNIPSYADKVSDNIFLWREIVNPVDLPENDVLKHPFSNNAFYVDAQVNIYLRRQDPDGINGLYHSGNIPDIQGQTKIQVNNEYKKENELTC